MSTATVESAPAREKDRTVKETAKVLRVHPQSVYRWIWDGRLGHERRGNKIFVTPAHLKAFRKANSYPASDNSQAE